MLYLSEINNEFITVGEITFNENMESVFSDEEIQWDQIVSIQFSASKEDLLIKLQSKEEIIIPDDTSGLVTLLFYAPASLINDQLLDDLKKIKEDLQDCPVCGNQSIWNNQCHVCHVEKEEFFHDDQTQMDAKIKELQLSLFATFDKDESIDWEFVNEPKFKRIDNWKILVSEAEVLDYSKNNTWNQKF